MSKIIPPTVGRVLLVFFCERTLRTKALACSPGHPLPALVAHVHNDRLINVGGFDAEGRPFSHTSLLLIQPDIELVDKSVDFAEWMPHQVGQAAKTESHFHDLIGPLVMRIAALEAAIDDKALQVYDKVTAPAERPVPLPEPTKKTK